MSLATRAPAALAALPLLTGLTACSVIVSGTDIPTCTDDADCEVGNTLFPERVDDCHRYQCNVTRGRCELAPLDRDDDGEVGVACGGTDCDDTSPARYAGNREACDGLDNDCDLLVDEALPDDADLGAVPSGTVAAPSGALARVSEVAPETWVTWSSMGDAALVALTGPDGATSPRPIVPEARSLGWDGARVERVATGAGTCADAVREPISAPMPETRRAGTCAFDVDCDDAVACTVDRCDVATNTCEHVLQHSACDDGTLCNGHELCAPAMTSDPSGCIAVTTPVCSSGLACDDASASCVGLTVGAPCSAERVSVARAASVTVVATIDDTCPSGTVRLGFDEGASTSGPLASVQAGLGPSAPTIERGVDEVDGCTRGGADSVSVAALASDPGRCDAAAVATALVAWSASPLDAERQECGPRTAPVNVRALGAWRIVADGAEPLFVPTAGGVPIVLGQTRSRGAPALVGVDGLTFLAAFASADGGVAIQSVAELACPPSLSDDLARTAPLELGATRAVGEGSVETVFLARGPSDAARALFALTFAVGCRAESRSYFAVLSVDCATGALEVTTPLEVTGADRAASHATAAWLSRPVVLAGAPGAPSDEGAWLVAWVDELTSSSRVVARRFRRDGASAVESLSGAPDAPFVVSVPIGDGPEAARRPLALATSDGAGYVAWANEAAPDLALRAACGRAR